MTESDRSRGPGEELRTLDEACSPEDSEYGPPVAIVGMACRFPGADGLSAFWSLLEAGGNAVQEGIPGSGVGRVGTLFPDDTGQVDACRFGAYLDSQEAAAHSEDRAQLTSTSSAPTERERSLPPRSAWGLIRRREPLGRL